MTPPTEDLPDYRRMAYEEMRAIVKWGLENGLLSVRRTFEDANALSSDLKPKSTHKGRIEIMR